MKKEAVKLLPLLFFRNRGVMGMLAKIGREEVYKGFILLLIGGFLGYGLSRIYGMSIYPDEFGYWASAAALVGWDWSEVASLGSYYSFGYSLLLAPILWLTGDSVTAYRVAVGINAVFLCGAFFLLLSMSRTLFGRVEEEGRIFLSAAVVLYPGWLFYLQTTLVEAMLMFMVVFITFLFQRFLERKKKWTGLLLILAAVYSYSLHLRALGVLAAVLFTLFLWGLCSRKEGKQWLLLLAGMGVLFLATFGIKEVVQQVVFTGGTTESLNVNDYGGQFGKLQQLLTGEGIRNFAVNLAGKLVYLGSASGGLAYWGFWWCITRIQTLIQKIRNKEEQPVEGWIAVFILLLALGQLLICGIYTVGTYTPDWMIYGRYIELVIPMLIFLGIDQLYQQVHSLKGGIVVFILYSLAAILCMLAVKPMEPSRVRGEHSVMISALVGEEAILPLPFFIQVWVIGSLTIGLVFLLIRLLKRKREGWWIAGLLLGLELLVGRGISIPHIYHSNLNMRMDLTIADVIKEREEEVFFLKENEEKWIGFLQMQLRERPIQVIEPEELAKLNPEETILLVYYNSQYLAQLEKRYGQKITADVYYVFY